MRAARAVVALALPAVDPRWLILAGLVAWVLWWWVHMTLGVILRMDVLRFLGVITDRGCRVL